MESEKDILKKYEAQLKGRVNIEDELPSNEEFSQEYSRFKEEIVSKKMSNYETWCNATEKIIQINPGKEKIEELKKSIEAAHLNITPLGASSFAIIIILIVTLLAILIGLTSYILNPENPTILTPLLLVIIGAFLIRPITNIPIFIANKWRLKASNQMVLCVLYIVMYMRHTSNLEHAIKFAADHIGPPLSLDLRKIFWDVETQRYSTIKESLDNYLEMWRHFNQEFITSFHLIESSLYETSESRRLELLDKALEVILNGTYEKMLHYAQDLKNPITMLHMLGVILPILGLVLFPLIGAFMGGTVKWYHLAILYNILLPFIVYVMGANVLAKRPTGYGESEISKNLLIKKPYALAIFVSLIFLFLGFLPLIIHFIDPKIDLDFDKYGKLFDYRGNNGPYGIGALILSLFIPLGFALGISLYYKIQTKELIKIRNETKELEKEFASSLFQLGNRIGDGIPSELAFDTVSKTMEGTPTGNFFSIVSTNISNLGMSMKEAIFNSKVGAIMSYPSSLIESSMEVLLESSKKGPKIVAQSLISISTYVDKIHSVDERLKDLLSEIISSMKSQISFLTPIIAGIVVGIASMIVNIIGNLGNIFSQYSAQNASASSAEISSLGAITTIFQIKDVIPSYYFQFVVGIYVVEITYILTILANGIENGPDKLNQDYLLGKNMLTATLLYLIIAFGVIVIFNLLASTILLSTTQLTG